MTNRLVFYCVLNIKVTFFLEKIEERILKHISELYTKVRDFIAVSDKTISGRMRKGYILKYEKFVPVITHNFDKNLSRNLYGNKTLMGCTPTSLQNKFTCFLTIPSANILIP